MAKKVRKFKRGGVIVCIDKETGEQWTETDTGPSTAKKALNFIKAGTRHIVTGRKKASDEVRKQRFDTCQNCPSNLYVILDPSTLRNTLKVAGEVGTCNHGNCGCYLHATATFPNKLAWEDSSCPKNHWKK